MAETIDVSGQKVKIIKDLIESKKKSLVYLDPPYYPTAKNKDGKITPYKLYNGNDWIPVDFLRLKNRCDELTNNGIPFVLSNSDCEFIRTLFQEYVIVEIDERRSLKNVNRNSSEQCLIITNFKSKTEFMESIRTLS